MSKKVIVHPGQKVMTNEGIVAVVAMIFGGEIYTYATDGWYRKVQVVGDAYGGEHDQEIGMAA